MNIKSLVLVGILVIIGGGAFVYFDPMDMDLLGMKQKPAVAKSAAQLPSAAPKPAVAPTQAKAPVAAPATVAPIQAKAPVAAPPATPSPAATPVAALAQAALPPMKLSQETKTASRPAIDKPMRSKNLDLRHCLDLEIDAAIAKCAGE